jgi:hypothetical protein
VGAALLSFSNTNNMFVSSYYTICIVQMVSVMTSHGLQWDGPNPLPPPPPPPYVPNIIVSGKNKNCSKIQRKYVSEVPQGIISSIYFLRLESLSNVFTYNLKEKVAQTILYF